MNARVQQDEFKNSVEDYLKFCAETSNTHEGDCAVTRALAARLGEGGGK